MHRLLAVGMCALILAAIAVALPSQQVPTVDAASACTNWKSTKVPPTTIRVLRTSGSAAGKVQRVPFRAYVENVMSWEWPDSYPMQALRAGAVAVKQYAWYYAIHWRGGTKGGTCYDVKDTSADQLYRPETRSATTKQVRAVASTWNLSIRRKRDGKLGRFILTGYLPGSIATCGAERNGFRLYQKGVKACAKDGKSSEEIARIYYGGTLELTETGRHNTIGAPFTQGDLGAAVPATNDTDIHVHRTAGDAFLAGAGPDTIGTAPSDTLGRLSADIDGDGLEEFVSLVSTGATSQRLDVRRAAGYGVGDPVAGWSWDSQTAGLALESRRDGRAAVRPVAADIDSDGDDDVFLIVTGASGDDAVYVLEAQPSAFQAIAQAFAGDLDAADSRPFAADATGDGRADVVLLADAAEGLRVQVMKTSATLAGDPIVIGAPTTWTTLAGLTQAGVRVVATDYNRDSRDDLVVAVASGGGTAFHGLRSTGKAFSSVALGSTGLDVGRLKLVTSDIDNNGRGDIVAYVRQAGGAAGTRLMTYRSLGTSLANGDLWLDDTSLDWEAVEPY